MKKPVAKSEPDNGNGHHPLRDRLCLLIRKALWKLSWFLRDFGYDTELLGRDELDEKRLVGLEGVIKGSHTTISGRTYVNLDAFAPSGEWDEFSLLATPNRAHRS